MTMMQKIAEDRAYEQKLFRQAYKAHRELIDTPEDSDWYKNIRKHYDAYMIVIEDLGDRVFYKYKDYELREDRRSEKAEEASA